MLGALPPIGERVPGVLAESWGVSLVDLTYLPVGMGSWHWLAMTDDGRRLFVTLDSVEESGAGFGHLGAAYGVPLALAAAGSRDVRAPLPAVGGALLVPLDDVWCVSVWPHLEGRTLGSGEYHDRADADAVLRVLRRLHDLPTTAAAPPVETFAFDRRPRLLAVLDPESATWDGGPDGAQAGALVQRGADQVHRLLAHHDTLVATAPPVDQWVLTHGEPHGANVVFVPDADEHGGERPVLIDWDTALLAPCRRDAWMVLADPAASAEAYGDGPLDANILALYRARWDLDEIGHFGSRLAGVHGDDDLDRYALTALARYLDVGQRWPDLTLSRQEAKRARSTLEVETRSSRVVSADR